MRYVLAVAELGSFSLASQACHVGQPALSQQVARLEKELGLALFTRSSRGVALTEAGREFVRRAGEIVQRADALQAEMALYAGVRRGTLNLGIITSLQCTHRLLELLMDRKIDAAFLNRPMSGIPSGLEFVKLGEDVYSLAVPTLHPLAKREQASLRELRDEHFIFHQTGQVASELCCRAAGFEPNIVCRSASPTTGLYMVQGGLGVALLPSEEFSARKLKGITELKLKEKIVKEVGAAWRKDISSPLVDAIVGFSQDWVK